MDCNFALTHLRCSLARWWLQSERKHTHGRWQCPKQFVKVEFVENLVFLQCICNVRLSSILEFGTMGFSTWQLSLPPCISRLAWRNSVDKVLLSSVTCNFIQLWLSYLHFLGLCSNLRTAFPTIFLGGRFSKPWKIGLYLLMGVNLEPIVDPPGHRRSGKGAKGQTSETLVVAGKEGNIGNSSSQLHR